MKLLNTLKNTLKIRHYFLLLVLILYLYLYLSNYILFKNSLLKFWNYFLQLYPSLILVFILLFIFNIFFNKKALKKYLTTSLKRKKYSIIVILGIISSGPIYFWYPLLAELKKLGLNDILITVFLYNRSIKLSLLPLMLTYFSFKFVVVFIGLTVVFSFFSGIIVNFLLYKRIGLS